MWQNTSLTLQHHFTATITFEKVDGGGHLKGLPLWRLLSRSARWLLQLCLAFERRQTNQLLDRTWRDDRDVYRWEWVAEDGRDKSDNNRQLTTTSQWRFSVIQVRVKVEEFCSVTGRELFSEKTFRGFFSSNWWPTFGLRVLRATDKPQETNTHWVCPSRFLILSLCAKWLRLILFSTPTRF